MSPMYMMYTIDLYNVLTINLLDSEKKLREDWHYSPIRSLPFPHPSSPADVI